MSIRPLQDLWDDLWFKPVSPAPVCVFRILYGLLALILGFLWAPDFLNWFGRDGVVSAATVQQLHPRLSLLLWLNPSDPVTLSLLGLYMLAALCLMLGLGTRVSSFIVWFLLMSFTQRNPAYWLSSTVAIRMFGLLLMFAPCGEMYSLDNWLRKKYKPQSSGVKFCSPWAQRLMQFQTAAIYWQASWSKLMGEYWRNGTAIYYVTHLQEYVRFLLPYVFDHLWTVKLLTWETMVIEFSLWSLIWIKECRYWVLLAGLIFHSVINLTINLDLLEFAVMGSYINFVYPEDLERVLKYCKNQLLRCLRNYGRS